MRPLFPLLGIFLVGCPAPYGTKVNVTVPTEVQAAFSAAQPGLVMIDDQAFALLCDPTDKALTFVVWPETGNMKCEGPQGQPYTVYAFRLDPRDLDSLTPLQKMFVTCGKSAKIGDGGAIAAIAELVQKKNLGATGRIASAVPAGGACDGNGDWSMDATLALSP
jgi:hypothetical protein